ncbi:MAG: SDR family NAD(P)-dependent oxidoreductase, partial [Acetobacteraceae bacterium]
IDTGQPLTGRYQSASATGGEGTGMDLKLSGRTALVTGASMGIGRAIARALAAEGVRLAVVARRGELLEALGTEIVAQGSVQPAAIVQDIMARDAAVALRDRALAALGRVEIVVNCAGGSRPLPLDGPEEAWEEALTLNFTRQRQLTHALLPQMIAHGWGRIINITGKSEPDRLNAAFAAKAAMHAWAKGLSREVGRHGITVNSIPPGRIMSEQIRRNYPEAERERFAAAEIPVGRYGEPEELASLAVFLASPLAGYITGAVIPVDGGLRRYSF